MPNGETHITVDLLHERTGDYCIAAHPEREQAPIVDLVNVHKTYLLGIEGVAALRGVSLKIYPGEWIVIYGASGGGKTTLLNILGTIDKPTKGHLTISNTKITANTNDEVLANLRLCNLGFVFQTFNLLSSMTALENVELPMTLKATTKGKEKERLARESLERVGMGHRLNHFPNQLSGGEQQRVTIARAIANLPQLLLLDEPTGDLDTENTRLVINLLNRLNCDNNMTMVMVTHDMYLKNFAHRVIWMRDGRIAKEETISPEKREEAFSELLKSMESTRVHGRHGKNALSDSVNQSIQRDPENAGHLPAMSEHARDLLLEGHGPRINGQFLSSVFWPSSPGVSGPKAAQPGKRQWTHTEIRAPSDYKTHAFAAPSAAAQVSPEQARRAADGQQQQQQQQQRHTGAAASPALQPQTTPGGSSSGAQRSPRIVRSSSALVMMPAAAAFASPPTLGIASSPRLQAGSGAPASAFIDDASGALASPSESIGRQSTKSQPYASPGIQIIKTSLAV